MSAARVSKYPRYAISSPNAANVHTSNRARSAIFAFSAISFANAGGDGGGQNNPVIGSIANWPSRIRTPAATNAMRNMRRHDAGRLNPIDDHLPSRSQTDARPSANKTMTMNAPSSSSSALNAREADGLEEGNGVSVSSAIEQISIYSFFTCDARWARNRFENLQATGVLGRRWAMEMLRARAHADEAGRNLPQNWKPFQQTKHERN